MVNYGKVTSVEKPESIRMDDYSVWECSNIEEISKVDPESGAERTEYEFDMIQYSKDEYILKTNDEVTDLLVQIATVEVEAGNLELESINEAFQGAVKLKIEDGKRLDK